MNLKLIVLMCLVPLGCDNPPPIEPMDLGRLPDLPRPMPPALQITAPSIVTTGKTGLSASVSIVEGATYHWAVSGVTLTSGADSNVITFDAGAVGSAKLAVTVTNDVGTTVTPRRAITVVAAAAPCAIRTASKLAVSRSGALAEVSPAVAGLTYSWSLSAGTLAAPGTGLRVSFSAPAATGSLTLTCTASNAAGDSVPNIKTIAVVAQGYELVAGTIGAPGIQDRTLGAALPAKLNSPRGLAVLDDGRLVVADTSNNCIRVITPTDNDAAVATLDGITCGGTQLNQPEGVAARIDSAGGTEVLIADGGNHRIMRWYQAPGGVPVSLTVLAGTGNIGTEDGPVNGVTPPRFNAPTDVVLDRARNCLYVAEHGNHSVRRLSLASPVTVSTLAGLAGTSGATYGTLAAPIVATSARLLNPHGLGLAANGLLFVAENGDQVIRIDLTASAPTAALWNAPAGLHRHVAIGTSGEVFVTRTDRDRVTQVTALGSTDVVGDGSASVLTTSILPGPFDDPDGIATDPFSGDLYVSSSNQHVIVRVRQ